MHGKQFIGVVGFFFLLAGCSSNSLMKPDCHSCTVEEQEWEDFSWNALVGRWKGSLQNVRTSGEAKKTQTDKPVDLVFVDAAGFLRAHGNSCRNIPPNAIVINGHLWESGSATKDYEAFLPADDDKVAYGRITIEKMNGATVCNFRRFGRVMGKNRLNLPAISFTDTSVTKSRMPASVGATQDFNVEFLRFSPLDKRIGNFQGGGRMPASAREQERPTLILRVFRVSRLNEGERGKWNGTEEYIYRLWKAE